MDTNGITQLWNSFNGSFDGFSNGDIFNGAMWNIFPKSLSTTILVNPDIYDQVIYEICGRYGDREFKGKNGVIYRCLMAQGQDIQKVAITCYPSTATLSIQGGAHQQWVEDILPEIENKISAEESLPLPCASSTPVHQSSSTSHHTPHSTDTDLPNFDLRV